MNTTLCTCLHTVSAIQSIETLARGSSRKWRLCRRYADLPDDSTINVGWHREMIATIEELGPAGLRHASSDEVHE